jgi:hypothetical protein
MLELPRGWADRIYEHFYETCSNCREVGQMAKKREPEAALKAQDTKLQVGEGDEWISVYAPVLTAPLKSQDGMV